MQCGLAASQALRSEQNKKTDAVMIELPLLGALCEDLRVQPPVAIELSRQVQKLGTGGYGQARHHFAAFPHQIPLVLCPRSFALVLPSTPNMCSC